MAESHFKTSNSSNLINLARFFYPLVEFWNIHENIDFRSKTLGFCHGRSRIHSVNIE
jgi:hypothetical protein